MGGRENAKNSRARVSKLYSSLTVSERAAHRFATSIRPRARHKEALYKSGKLLVML